MFLFVLFSLPKRTKKLVAVNKLSRKLRAQTTACLKSGDASWSLGRDRNRRNYKSAQNNHDSRPKASQVNHNGCNIVCLLALVFYEISSMRRPPTIQIHITRPVLLLLLLKENIAPTEFRQQWAVGEWSRRAADDLLRASQTYGQTLFSAYLLHSKTSKL